MVPEAMKYNKNNKQQNKENLELSLYLKSLLLSFFFFLNN